MPTVKLVSLNIYGCQYPEPLNDFLVHQARDTDLFCLQEIFSTLSDIRESRGIRANGFAEISRLLIGFTGYFASLKKGFDLKGLVDFDLDCGIAIFVRKRWLATDYGLVESNHRKFELNDAPVGDVDALSSKFQHVRIWIHGKQFTVCNYYGAWYPGSKLDTDERLTQTKLLIGFMRQRLADHRVIIGDFNLLPRTRCILDIEEAGYIDLINAFDIKTTRGKFGKSLFPQYHDNFQEYTDYAFTSSGLEILDFQVPDIAISDHLPLILKASF